MVEAGGPTDCIKVTDDEYPDVVTTVLAHQVWGRQPTLYTAYGEQAGMNLVQSLEGDGRLEIQRVQVVDYTNLAMHSIARNFTPER